MLDLDFDAEQEMLATTVRDVLATPLPADGGAPDGGRPVGYPAELWRSWASSTWSGLLLPEPYGGPG